MKTEKDVRSLEEFTQLFFVPVLIFWEGFTPEYIWHEDLGWGIALEVG
jgi:hypothetical protein